MGSGSDARNHEPDATCEGGYCLVPVIQLAALWWAYRRGRIRFLDLRAALAAREMVARRMARPTGPGRMPRYTLRELTALTGSEPRRLKPAIHRLRLAGLLRWDDTLIEFDHGDGAEPDAPFRRWIRGIANHRRRVPVPRRILRRLARESRPVLVATALAVLLRCLYLRDGRLAPRGRFKAAWVADTFQVAIRRVKAARAELVDSGWLIPDAGDSQAAMNRWGRAFAVNTRWTEPHDGARVPSTMPVVAPEKAPPRHDPGPEKAPLISNRDPLARARHQEPARGNRPGVCDSGPGGKGGGLPDPDVRRVRAEDLRSTPRLLELHRQAAAWGLVGTSESDRLKVVAAAEHALAVATSNASGLFATVLREGLWSHLSSSDDEAAVRRLKAHLHGAPPGRVIAGVSPPPPASPAMSSDARLVIAVRAHLAGRGDPYLALRRESSGWTRERYDRAVLDLEASRLACRASSVEGPRGVALLGTVLSRFAPVSS